MSLRIASTYIPGVVSLFLVCSAAAVKPVYETAMSASFPLAFQLYNLDEPLDVHAESNEHGVSVQPLMNHAEVNEHGVSVQRLNVPR